MTLIGRFQQAVLELDEQSRILKDSCGGCLFLWKLDMAWCLLRYGARPIDYVRFEFHKKSARERNRYLTIFRYFRLQNRFGAGMQGVKGKVEEYRTFSPYIKRNWIEINQATPTCLVSDFVQKYSVVIAKPINGEQGKGVLKIEGIDSSEYKELLENRRSISYVVEEKVVNCRELEVINPSSLNTVRATTLILKNGLPKIVSIILRVGAPGSHVDNWGSGGVGYNFDIETGICNMYGRDKKNRLYTYHPGSNVQMIGFKLPHFEELKQYIISLTKIFPSARYVGWDIAITPKGFDLIEMNCPAGHDMFQSFDNPVYELMKNNL